MSATAPREHDSGNSSLRGTLLIVGSALAFSVMFVLVKAAGARIPSMEVVFARAVVSLVLSYVLLRREGLPVWGSNPALLTLRGMAGFFALSCVYYAVTRLPLADASVLQFLYPTFTALFAAVFLGERLRLAIVAGTLVSLLGVVVVARPPMLFGGAGSADPFAVSVAVGGSVMTAIAYVLVRRLSRTEHPLVIVFYFPLVTLPAALPFVLWNPVMPRGVEWLVLLGVGLATQFGQVWLTRGLQLLPAARASALSYLQIVFAIAWGMLLFGEEPEGWTMAGAALVVAGTAIASGVGSARAAVRN